MTTILPTDSNDNVIPTLRLKGGGAHSITTSVVAAKNASAFDADTRVVSIYATEAVYLRFGDNTAVATASDHYFPAGVYQSFSIGGDKTGHRTYISALSAGTDGTVYISEME